MKKLFIPSVVEYRMKDKVIDELARLLYDIERNKGSRFVSENKIENLVKAENYLNQQFDRLRKYAKEGKIKEFDYLAKVLLKNSDVFLLYAFNHSFPNHVSARTTKVLKLLMKVKEYALNEENELKYKRVWIDKKPGDSGRPLGVPEFADRIYGHMMTRLMEAYLCGTNQYSSNQHGGVPGRGVQTFLKALIEPFMKHKKILEFDIKGYFDHIKHSSILEMFKSKTILHYLSGALKSKPKSYSLPEKEKDRAYQLYTERDLVSFFEVSFREDGMVDITPRNEQYGKFMLTLSFNPETRPVIINKELLRKLQPHLQMDDWRITYTPMHHLGLGTRIRLVHLITNWETDLYTQEPILDIQRVTLAELYKQAMNCGFIEPDNINPFAIEKESPTEADRNIGRDRWKDLDLPDQGVPQGSSFGPVLASVLLGKLMPSNSLLYMDDGIIFLNSSPSHKMIMERYNKLLKVIGCELSPDKTNILTPKVLWRKGMKIVGLRLFKRTLFTDRLHIQSDTRRGTIKPLYEMTPEQVEIGLREMLKWKLISPSKSRVLNWQLEKGKLDEIYRSPLIDLSDRLGLLGAILSRAYSPTTTVEEMKEQIEYGIFKAELKIKSAKGSLGERLMNMKGTILLEGTESKIHVKPNLYIIRPIVNNLILRYLKGDLPEKKLRVQGMRKRLRNVK
jgi:hypothetical protein